ncbi:MAG: putative ABC transporter permease, partial [Lachnospiraceae bacterium]
CNKKLTNRGFVKGPFCPIYGIGALTVFFVLRDYSDSALSLFLLGALLATSLEFITAIIMHRIFGEIWWDYEEKPFNYKGIVCLESSIAWGFYTIFLFMFLQRFVMYLTNLVSVGVGRAIGSAILLAFAFDFASTLYREKKDVIPERVQGLKAILLERISR